MNTTIIPCTAATRPMEKGIHNLVANTSTIQSIKCELTFHVLAHNTIWRVKFFQNSKEDKILTLHVTSA